MEQQDNEVNAMEKKLADIKSKNEQMILGKIKVVRDKGKEMKK